MGGERSIEMTIENGLVKPGFDLMLDYSEMTLDTFLDSEAVKQIPIIKTIVGVIKGAAAIREVFFAKKLIVFLQSYHNGLLSEEQKLAFNKKFSEQSSYRDSVVQEITIMLERSVNIDKAKVLSNLFQAHVNDKLEWKEFCYLTEHLDSIHSRAFEILRDSETSKFPFSFTTNGGKDGGGILVGAGLAIIQGNHYDISGWGIALYHYGIKGDINYSFPSSDAAQSI